MTHYQQLLIDTRTDIDAATDRLDTWLANSHKDKPTEPIKKVLDDLLETMGRLPKPVDTTDLALYVAPGSAEVWVVFPGGPKEMRVWRLACGEGRTPFFNAGSERRDCMIAAALLDAATAEVQDAQDEFQRSKAVGR